MSAGRQSVSLADLQKVAHDGYSTSVRKMLLGEQAPARPAEVREPEVLPEWMTVAAANVEADAYGKPADWAHRTTHADVRRLACELACERLREQDAPLVWKMGMRHALPEDYKVTRAATERVHKMLGRCYGQVLREMPQMPGKRVKTERMPTRSSVRGECSKVVRKYRGGGYMVDGEIVTEAEAQAVLRRTGVR